MKYLGRTEGNYATVFTFDLKEGRVQVKVSDIEVALVLNKTLIYKEDLSKESTEFIIETLKRLG